MRRGDVVSDQDARQECPHWKQDQTSVTATAGGKAPARDDGNVLVAEDRKLGTYHQHGVDGNVYYKGEKISGGGQLKDLGDGRQQAACEGRQCRGRFGDRADDVNNSRCREVFGMARAP